MSILYLASMRFAYLILLAFLMTACGGRSTMNKHLARDLIMEIPNEALEKKDIEIINVTQVSGTEAIAETTLRTAFRLEKSRGVWVIREVRLGHGQWEKVDNLIQTLEQVKASETREMVGRILAGVKKYQESKGALPSFQDYIGLSDQLSPRFMTPLIRLDAWRRPFGAERTSNSVTIRSAGTDGRFGTSDDIMGTFP